MNPSSREGDAGDRRAVEAGRQDPDSVGFSDRPGRVKESANQARHGMEPRSDPKAVRAQRFARGLVDYLNDARQTGRIDRLVIAAPPRFMGLLDASMNPAVHDLVAHREREDLIHESARDPLARLSRSARPGV
jgi:protein required for attachment to host cells